MKKTLVLMLAVLLVVAFTLPASAFENVFGGYNRTRIVTQKNFLGNEKAPLAFGEDTTKFELDPDTGSIVPVEKQVGPTNNVTRFDNRTRLYYTAVFSENFSFVNKFEFNSIWGDTNGGDIGADGDTFVVKNSYVDFRTGAFRHTVGIQPAVIARGFLFDDDFSGYLARYQPGTTADLLVPLVWIQEVSGAGASEPTPSTADKALLGAYPFFPIGEAMVLNPYLIYGWRNSSATYPNDKPWWVGVDFDWKADTFGLSLSGIYSGGDGGVSGTGATAVNVDNKGYLLFGGVDFNLGAIGLWLDVIYATGDDGKNAKDNDAFNLPKGNSYYWAEIMGLGIFDNQASANAPGNNISNLLTVGIGADWKLGDKTKLSTDLWWAKLAEKASYDGDELDEQGIVVSPSTQDELGIELDLILTTAIMENLNLDLVVAYLVAGDATSANGKNEDNPYEVGARLSFGF